MSDSVCYDSAKCKELLIGRAGASRQSRSNRVNHSCAALFLFLTMHVVFRVVPHHVVGSLFFREYQYKFQPHVILVARQALSVCRIRLVQSVSSVQRWHDVSTRARSNACAGQSHQEPNHVDESACGLDGGSARNRHRLTKLRGEAATVAEPTRRHVRRLPCPWLPVEKTWISKDINPRRRVFQFKRPVAKSSTSAHHVWLPDTPKEIGYPKLSRWQSLFTWRRILATEDLHVALEVP